MAVQLHISLVERDDYLWTMLFWRYKDHKFINGKPVFLNIGKYKIENNQLIDQGKILKLCHRSRRIREWKNIHKWGTLN